MSELAKCPCGAIAGMRTDADSDGFGRFVFIECGKCGLRSRGKYFSKGNDCPMIRQEARDEWNETFADHAARVAELEHRLANCDADLHAMQQAKDRAERMHADYLACEEPAAVSDPDLIALLPVWAGKWINDLKAASAQHMLQALNNGQSARLQRERADRAERRLGALQAFARDVMTSWPEGDVDGGALQDYAEKHGLIVPQEAIESCGDDCVCAYYGQFPMTCYRKTELLTGQPA